MHCLDLVILIYQKYLFCVYSKWQQIRVLQARIKVCNLLWWLRSVNHVRFIEECVWRSMFLAKKSVHKCDKHGLATTSLNQKDSLWNGNTLTLVKKVLSPAVSKEGNADSLLGYEWIYHYWFSWNVEIVNSASYCWFLWQYFTLFIEWPMYVCVCDIYKRIRIWRKFEKVIQSEEFNVKESLFYNVSVLINHHQDVVKILFNVVRSLNF